MVPSRTFGFPPENLRGPCDRRYQGKWRFEKHFYPLIAKLRNGGEEFKCALTIDSHPKVKHWVRNLERDVEGAFWLPTSYGRFFPDFVAELNDGRIFVVEYKGEHWRRPTEIEKDQVGRLWPRRAPENAFS